MFPPRPVRPPARLRVPPPEGNTLSRSLSHWRGAGLVGLTVLTALTAAPSAGATAYTVDALCRISFLSSEQPVQIGIDVPDRVAPGAAVVPFKVTSATRP